MEIEISSTWHTVANIIQFPTSSKGYTSTRTFLPFFFHPFTPSPLSRNKKSYNPGFLARDFALCNDWPVALRHLGYRQSWREQERKKKEERAASGPMQTSEVGRPPKVSLSSESWETLLPKGFSIWFIDTKISIFLLGKFPLLRFHGRRIAVFLSSLLSMTLQEWNFSLHTLPMLMSDFVVDQLGNLYFVGPPDASRPRPSPITVPYTRN